MGTSLSGTKIKDTYDGLIKTSNNAAVGSSNVELTDGLGNDINISLNNTGDLTADGDITGASIIKSGGTATQILLANGTVVTLTLEASGIGSNDSDSNVPTNAAVKDYVDDEIADLIDNSPSALDTLNELAAALGDDANFSTTVTTGLGNRLRIDVNNQGLTTAEKTNALTNLGVSSSPTELNILDGATLSTAELNFVDGVTSAIQTQIDSKQDELTAGTGIDITNNTISADIDTSSIQGNAVTPPKLDQFDDNLTAATAGDILVSNGTDFDNVSVTGDVTIDSSGVTTIGSGTVENGMLAADSVNGDKIADDAIDSEHIADDAIDTQHYTAGSVDNSALGADSVDGNKIADDVVDSEHIAAGAIDSEHFSAGSVDTTALGADSVNGTKIADNAINTEHIFDDAVTDAKLANDKQNVKEPHSSSAQTFTVTVATKTSAHRYNGSGSSNGYLIDSIEAPYITITAGNTYRFDQSDSSNTGHPLAFYYESDKTTSYTTGVTTNGTAGSSGAYTQIIATDSTPTVLHYQCTAHSLMGNTVNFDTRNLTGFDTDDLGEGSSNLYFSDERAQDAAASMITGGTHTNLTATYNDGSNTLDLAVTGGGSVSDAFKTISVSGQSDVVADSATDTLTLAAGSNITLTTNASTDTVTIASTASGGGGGTLDIEQQTFDGDGSTVAFTLTSSCDSENNLQVYIDGVYQSKDNFSVSGTTLTFSTAPATGTDNIEVMHLKSVIGNIRVDTFTGDGTDATFDLTHTISVENNTQVFIDGVYQSKDNYSTSGTTVTFTTAPQSGTAIEVVHIVPDSAGGGISWDTTVKTAAFTATAGEGYFVNTTSAAITVTLPSSPSAGDEVSIVDYAGTADTNNITITSSDNINGASDDLLINYERGGVSIVYVDATQGWIAYNAANETDTALNRTPLTVDYLVVAGGGGGASLFGGGGAGGYRTSYGDSNVSALSLLPSTNYTVTVGPGGAGGTATSSATTIGSDGSDSVFSSITSTGGGGGSGTNSDSAGDGGSGGGGSDWSSAGYPGGTGNTPSTTPSQGNNGGSGSGSNAGGGGGGGASTAGQDGTTSGGGSGGNGLSNSITGSAETYAGGGGGGTYTGSYPSAVGGSGGTGGGGNGGATAGTSGGNGTNNLGGGGGGGTRSNQTVAGGTGGSGVVILRYPDSYTISETTSPTVLTFSTDDSISGVKVTTFTAGENGTIQFS